MSSWLNDFGQQRVLCTYGKKKVQTTVDFNRPTSFSSSLDDSPPINTNNNAGNDFKKRHILIERGNILPLENRPGIDTSEKKRKALETEERKFSKSKMDLKELMSTAHKDDLSYLYDQLIKFEITSETEAVFRISEPMEWSNFDKQRFETWLQHIGFKVPRYASQASYSYPFNKVDELKTLVFNVCSNSEIRKTREVLGMISRISPSTVDEAKTCFDPVSVAPSSVFLPTQSLPILPTFQQQRVDTQVAFLSYRRSNDEISDESSSMAGSPAALSLNSPATYLNSNKGFPFYTQKRERRDSAISFDSARSDRHGIIEEDEGEINESIGDNFTKMGLDRGLSANSASSTSLNEQLLEQEPEDNGSISTIADAMETIDVAEEDEDISADIVTAVLSSATEAETSLVSEPTTDISMDSQGLASLRPDSFPDSHLSSPLATRIRPSEASHMNDFLQDTSMMESAFDVSFSRGAVLPLRSRLRRSKSMPVPCRISMNPPEATPGKSFSQDNLHAQTPLRPEVAKVISGHEVIYDWGTSLPACQDIVGKLRELHARHRAHTTGSIGIPHSVSFGSKSPSAPHLPPILAQISGSLLSPHGSHTPLDVFRKGPVNQLSFGGTPFSSTGPMKYLSPLINNVHSMMRSGRSPMSLLHLASHSSHPSSMNSNAHRASSSTTSASEHEVINGDAISIARRALLSVRGHTQPTTYFTDLSMTQNTESSSPPLSVDDRKAARARKSKAKWRRVSIGLNASFRNLSMSPTPVGKCSSHPPANRRLSLNTSDGAMMDLVPSDEDKCVIHFVHHREQVRTESVFLDTHNFKGIIIGGTNQGCMEKGHLVIAPPSSNEKRVVAVRVTDFGFELDMFISKDSEIKTIKLGPNWNYMRSSPDGYIVFKETALHVKNFICYYLQRDPLEWIRETRRKEGSPRKVKFGPELVEHHEYDEIYRNEMDCGAVITAYEYADDDTMEENQGDDDNMEGVDEEHDSSTTDMTQQTSSESIQFHKKLISDTKVFADWNNSGVVSLVLEFLIGSNADVMKASTGSGRSRRNNAGGLKIILNSLQGVYPYRLVSKDWAVGYYRLLSRFLSDSKLTTIKQYDGWVDFVKKFSSGAYVSSGACKEVFCVQNQMSGQDEAVSVMDIEDLHERGMDLAISQELEISMLCSSLYDLKICPTMLKVHSVFQSTYSVPEDLWRRSTSRGIFIPPPPLPKASQLQKGKFQYMRSEFCKGGDLEGFVRKERQLPMSQVSSLLFQMLYSMYTCREKLALRHFDVKLLNFFVTTGSSLLHPAESRPLTGSLRNFILPPAMKEKSLVNVNIGFGDRVFVLHLHHDENELLKLADFGTSVIGAGTLGDSIGVNQFTTLENTPIEYLILGSNARQAYSADTFCLGLSFLHLLTGYEPYEELLKEVKCPILLKSQLKIIWETDDESSPYYVIHSVIDSLAEPEEGSLELPGDVLYDTLYRYIVLFDIPTEFNDAEYDMPWRNNSVWNCLIDCLGLGRNNNKHIKGISLQKSNVCIQQYTRDSEIWNFNTGNHAIMKNARDRLSTMNGGMNMFYRMIHYDPSRRCTAKEALLSPLFKCLEKMDNFTGTTVLGRTQTIDINYTHYYRSPLNGGINSLPMM